jgi:hypothetical protein
MRTPATRQNFLQGPERGGVVAKVLGELFSEVLGSYIDVCEDGAGE